MNTNWLREFVVLADTCSYAEAAARLFMGQSSLSKHIKALEEELGVRLVPCTTIAGHCVLPAVPAKALRVGSRRVQGFLAAFCRPETPPEHWTALLDSELAGQLGIR